MAYKQGASSTDKKGDSQLETEACMYHFFYSTACKTEHQSNSDKTIQAGTT